jgi:hypothetical protein
MMSYLTTLAERGDGLLVWESRHGYARMQKKDPICGGGWISKRVRCVEMHAPQPQPSVLSESQSPEDNDMSLDFIVEDPLVFKRKRSSKACELCRLRKVRCDGMSPQCSRCRQEFKECSYAIMRKRGPKSSNRKSISSYNTQKEFDSEDSGKFLHLNESPYCTEPSTKLDGLNYHFC